MASSGSGERDAGRGRRGWRWLRLAQRAAREFGERGGTLLAAAIAFYLLLSLVPLALVGISALGFVLGSSARAHAAVMEVLRYYLPGQEALIREAVEDVIRTRGSLGLLGLAGLAITALPGFDTLQSAVNRLWDAPNRGFLAGKALSLAAMVTVGGLLALSLGLSALAQWSERLPLMGPLLGDRPARLAALLLPVALSTTLFALVYRFFPNRPSRWGPAWWSGLAAAILWELFKNGYLFYTARLARPSDVHGTLAGFVGLVLWIYYSSVVTLFGAQLCRVLNEEADGASSGTGTPCC